MTIYLKTKFDSKPRKFAINKIAYDFGNRDHVEYEERDKFKEIKEYGILSLWIHPFEVDKWYNDLDDDGKSNFLFWEKGAISIPGDSIEVFSIER